MGHIQMQRMTTEYHITEKNQKIKRLLRYNMK